MKVAYKSCNFRSETLSLIQFMNRLIDSYQAQGFTLSVRQLYYQLVARNHIENTERSYKRVASIINDGRLAGLIDWDAIEDRNRDIVRRASWNSGADIVGACASSFHMDMWDNQECRLFVIVEKAALAGVLDEVCRRNDVPLLAARGYPSVSIVREMALEYLQPALQNGQGIRVLHLGDHDPSGMDMTRDLRERFELFLGDDADGLDLGRIALNMDQINEQKPPPNPAKATDARFQAYRREFGSESWELDALEPSYLVQLVEGEIDMVRDDTRWAERKDEIDSVKTALRETAKDYNARGI